MAEDKKAVKGREPDIHVIPEEFYGAALHAEAKAPPPTPAKTVAPKKAMPPAPKKSKAPIIILVVVIILILGGGGAYIFRDTLFPQESPIIVVETPEPTPPPIPSAPTNVQVTSTSHQSVSIKWSDESDTESGFRIERTMDEGVFAPVTSIQRNNTSFLDVSVSSGESYSYRIVALGVSGDSDPSEEVQVVVREIPDVPVSLLPPTGLDADSDGLTDIEEALYGTRVQGQDTDDDSFLDGNEVFHLYNPGGDAPVRLLDSNLVKVTNGTVGWVISIPTDWTLTENISQGMKATIDSQHGETFTIEIQDNSEKLPLEDWYAEAKGDEAQELMPYRSKGGYQGFITADLLITLIPWEDKVFVFKYHLNRQSYINFRTTYAMMLNSLELSGMPLVVELTEEPLPLEPAATSSESEES